MKQPVFFAAMLGWASAAGILITCSFYRNGASLGLFWLGPILVNIVWSGIFAFPVCFVAGFLVSKFLPPTFLWWKPQYAALCGGLCGAAIVILFRAWVISGEFAFQAKHLLRGVIGAVPGSVCGFTLARLKQKQMKLTTND